MKIRTEHYRNPSLPPKHIIEIGRWRIMFIIQMRRGRFQWGFERHAPGAYTAGFGFGMMTALRRSAAALVIACMALALVGCGSNGTSAPGSPTASPTPGTGSAFVTPANVQRASTLATSNALAFVNPEDQKEIAADTYSAAHALRTLSGGQAPTLEQVQATLTQFGGPTLKPGYRLLVGNLSALYASFYPDLVARGDAAANAKAIAYLEALATGAENGAAPYL